jgi:uncharacterized coiled-coil protein SlyX
LRPVVFGSDELQTLLDSNKSTIAALESDLVERNEHIKELMPQLTEHKDSVDELQVG